jgi:hypothetical protein
MIHQSSATGMQAIPTTGIAQGVQYKEKYKASLNPSEERGLPKPSEGGALTSDTSNKHYNYKKADSKNPPLEGREASPSGGRGADSYLLIGRRQQ